MNTTVELPQEYFIVFGMREDIDTKGKEKSLSVEILGMFTSLEDARIYMDISAESDTTIHGVTVVSVNPLSSVPEMEIFLHVSVSDDGEICVRSRCVDSDVEPWLRNDRDYFESLCYPEHREEIVKLASSFVSSRGKNPVVVDETSPTIQDYLVG